MDATANPSTTESPNSLCPVLTAALSHTAPVSEGGWRITESADQCWLYVSNDRAVRRQQGWKLHVSAGLSSAVEVLERTLPVLLSETASFKVAGTIDMLCSLNQGLGALSQVGKFITVYPNDEAQAVCLAVALDTATRGARGPVIPSSRPLRSGSLVHYRYGAFQDRRIQTPLGESVPALSAPDGALVPDLRASRYQAPEWVADPFATAGVAGDLPAPSQLIGGRFLVVGTLSVMPRGPMYMALDMETLQVCVLKGARRDALIDGRGHDARDRLRHETAVLRRLAPNPYIPVVYELVEQDGDLYLAMEDVQGDTLTNHVHALTQRGCVAREEQLVAWGRQLAQVLDTIHAQGFVYRDLKAANVILSPDGHIRLVDFDSALEWEAGSPSAHHGTTRGYESPQSHAGAAPAVTDDVYALGALLYFMATGIDPSIVPHPLALLDQPPAVANPTLGAGMAAVIERCLDADPALRYPSMAAVDAVLAVARQARADVAQSTHETSAAESEEQAPSRYRELARRLGDTLCSTALAQPNGGVAWVSSHPVAAGLLARDINTGNAGTILALAELVAELGCAEHRRVLGEAAAWLAGTPSVRSHAGLYIGESGVGAALLRSGQVLGDDRLIAAAAEKGRKVAAQPYTCPDMFNGTAGRIRFQLWLWDETAAAVYLEAAMQGGESLLEAAEVTGEGGLRWTIPPGYDALSGKACLGYAHGAAGIGDVLLDLFEVTGQRRFLAAAQGATRWLVSLAIPVLDDGSGLDWPRVEGGGLGGAFWCHGAAGIGRFFSHAARLDLLPEAADVAARAAWAVARGARWAGPTQCHGLAGNIECLLDVAQATGDRSYRAEAQSLARLLEAFASERAGGLMWPSESPLVFTPDYMVGYAGVAVCLLRLGAPERLAHQLSRAGFGRTSMATRSSRCGREPMQETATTCARRAQLDALPVTGDRDPSVPSVVRR